MKINLHSAKDEAMLKLLALNYVIKYYRCIIVQAKMEKVALNYFKGDKENLEQLNILNKKHNKLVINLFKQKQKMQKIA